MNVASLELSKELYGLSGWEDTTHTLYMNVTGQVSPVPRGEGGWCPAYDLGYLLRKLPRRTTPGKKTFDLCVIGTGWSAWYEGTKLEGVSNDSPEDAATMLAIELFKHGVLKKGEN